MEADKNSRKLFEAAENLEPVLCTSSCYHSLLSKRYSIPCDTIVHQFLFLLLPIDFCRAVAIFIRDLDFSDEFRRLREIEFAIRIELHCCLSERFVQYASISIYLNSLLLFFLNFQRKLHLSLSLLFLSPFLSYFCSRFFAVLLLHALASDRPVLNSTIVFHDRVVRKETGTLDASSEYRGFMMR